MSFLSSRAWIVHDQLSSFTALGVDCQINIYLYNLFHNIFVFFFLVNKKWLEDKDENFIPPRLTYTSSLHLARVFTIPQRW